MPNTPKPKYKGTQQELYAIAKAIIASLNTYVASFAAKKPLKYVPGFPIALDGKRSTAMNMLDDVQRTSISETYRIELMGLDGKCCDDFQDLKTYIRDGWAKEFWKVKNDEAGMVDYEDAAHFNWEKVVAMNLKMNAFIVAYPTELAAGYMPVGFGAQVIGDSKAFDIKYGKFQVARQTGVQTGAKLDADNLLFDVLQSVQNDAHNVFKHDAEKLKLFMYDTVKVVVSPPGSASLEIGLMELGTNLPVAGASVTIQSATGIAKTLVADVDGVVKYTSVDPDNYTVKVVMAGKPDINMVKEVNTGVNARLEIKVP